MDDKRRYIRLNSVFPVEFSLCFTPGKLISEEYQAFTCNVSEGGLCLTVRNLKTKDEQLILKAQAKFYLKINVPVTRRPARAMADIAWSKKDKKDAYGKTCLVGLSYSDINPQDKKRIFNYARRMKWMPRIASAVILLLLAGFAALSFYHIKSKKENQALIRELVSSSEKRGNIYRQLNELKASKRLLESMLSSRRGGIETLKGEIASIETKIGAEKERLKGQLVKALEEKRELQSKLSKLSAESTIVTDMVYKNSEARLVELKSGIETLRMELSEVAARGKSQIRGLQDKLAALESENRALRQGVKIKEHSEASLEEQLARIRLKSGELEKASIDKMLQWVKTHQVKRTGLVLSYEGDDMLKDYGFSYDEALSVQAFLMAGDQKRARAILNFYKNKAKRSKGLFYNAYDVRTGAPCEYKLHSGPNIWLGISASQYAKITGDRAYLSIAKQTADKMISLQSASDDGGIRGGPDDEWVSTEHNLDAYALFNMLYDLTGDEKYKEAGKVSLNWLKGAGYNRPEGRFMRGKGDATIATDTFSWSIAAIGPAVLAENGMRPDDIMEFAENECRVSASFYRPENKMVQVVGFDFAKAKNLGRGGIVSTEWTAQMVVAFKIMADYYREINNPKKADVYSSKAEYYLTQLGKMAISSPSPTGQGEGCLPYASIDNVDTGHGWRVAKGRRTGSVAATVYYIFAYKGYNPLSFRSRRN